VPGGILQFLHDGPLGHPQFAMLAPDLARLCEQADPAFAARETQADFRALVERTRAYFLTQDGKPRKAKGFAQGEFKRDHCRSESAWKQHRDGIEAAAGPIADAIKSFRRDVNVILSRGVWRMFHVATTAYVRTLES